MVSSSSTTADERESIQQTCNTLASLSWKRDLGTKIARRVLEYSPVDLGRMKVNFSDKLDSFTAEYKKELEGTIAVFLDGTYQVIRLMNQQGSFGTLEGEINTKNGEYWYMVASQCPDGKNGSDLRFLKYLLSGFCMFVQEIPGHPVGMPFPGGDKVDCIEGVYYCPVRNKAHDVDAALCPFCPAEQTPDIGYLKPPVRGSKHRKQEYIKNIYDYHHFNG